MPAQKLEIFVLHFLFFIVSSVLGIYLVYIFGSEGISNDLANYIGLFERLSYNSYDEALILEITEPGYLFLAWLLAKILSPQTLFLIAGILPLIYKINLLRKIDYGLAAVLFYFLLFLPIQESNQIRGALAGCFILLSLLLDAKSPIKYLILGLAASLFHYSGIIIIAFYVFSKTNSNLLSLLGLFCVSLVWNFLLSNISGLNFLLHQSSGTEIGVTFTNPIFWLQVSIIISTLLVYGNLTYQQKKGFHLILLGAGTYIFFAETPIIAHRIRELSLLGLFPLVFTRPSINSFSSIYNCFASSLIAFYTFSSTFGEVINYFSIF
tara:strand:+ start:44215 stop:45183 length:969 start_codon:yes stop_codon:yes gene_type:complete